MKQNKIANNLIYYLFCGFSGVVIALIVWLFLRIMNYGIEFVWTNVPSWIDIPFYPLIVCTLGGLILGVYQKVTNVVPDELGTIMLKVKRDKAYPYNKVLLLCVSALLPLIFGGSIGPEAGLTGIIVGLCYWAGNHMKYAKKHIPNLLEVGISATLGSVFYAPLFGLATPIEEKLDSDEQINPKSAKIASNIIAVLCSMGTILVLNQIFGRIGGLPRIGGFEITNIERLWGIPLALVGVAFGIIFILFEKITEKFFKKLQGKLGIIVSATLGGAILGVAGTYFPLVMFSGEESISELTETYMSFAPYLLILSGFLKLLVTNVCIKSGWKGGHFFPVIFCGVSIGYGVAMLSGLDPAFCTAVITGGLLGMIMQKPIAVTLLLLLCFDVRIVPWILLSAFIGQIIYKLMGNIGLIKK